MSQLRSSFRTGVPGPGDNRPSGISTIRETLAAARAITAAVASDTARPSAISNAVRRPIVAHPVKPALGNPDATSNLRSSGSAVPGPVAAPGPLAPTSGTVTTPQDIGVIRQLDRLRPIKPMQAVVQPMSAALDRGSAAQGMRHEDEDEDDRDQFDDASAIRPLRSDRMNQISLVRPSRPTTARIGRGIRPRPVGSETAVSGSSQGEGRSSPSEGKGVDSTPAPPGAKSLVEQEHVATAILLASLQQLFAQTQAGPVPTQSNGATTPVQPSASKLQKPAIPLPRPPPTTQFIPRSGVPFTQQLAGHDPSTSVPSSLPLARQTPQWKIARGVPICQILLHRIVKADGKFDEVTSGEAAWIAGLTLVALGDVLAAHSETLYSASSDVSMILRQRCEFLQSPVSKLTYLQEIASADIPQGLVQVSWLDSTQTLTSLASEAFQILLKLSSSAKFELCVVHCCDAIAYFMITGLNLVGGTSKMPALESIIFDRGINPRDKCQDALPLPRAMAEDIAHILAAGVHILHNMSASSSAKVRKSAASPLIQATISSILETSIWFALERMDLSEDDRVVMHYAITHAFAFEDMPLSIGVFLNVRPHVREGLISRALSLLRNLSRLRATTPTIVPVLDQGKGASPGSQVDTYVNFGAYGLLSRISNWLLLATLSSGVAHEIAFHCSRIYGRLSELPRYTQYLASDPALVLSLLGTMRTVGKELTNPSDPQDTLTLQTLVRLLYVSGNLSITPQSRVCRKLRLGNVGTVCCYATQEEGKDEASTIDATHAGLIVYALLSTPDGTPKKGIWHMSHLLYVLATKLRTLDSAVFSALPGQKTEDAEREQEASSQTLPMLLAAALTKLIRLIANTALDQEVGLALACIGRSNLELEWYEKYDKYGKEQTTKGRLLDETTVHLEGCVPTCLGHVLDFCTLCSPDVLPELTLNAVACLTNVSYYSWSSVFNQGSSDPSFATPAYFLKLVPTMTLPSLLSILMYAANKLLATESNSAEPHAEQSFLLELVVETTRALGNASREKFHKAYLAISGVAEALLLLLQSERLTRSAPQLIQGAGGVLINLATNAYPSFGDPTQDDPCMTALREFVLTKDADAAEHTLLTEGNFVHVVACRQEWFMVETCLHLVERSTHQLEALVNQWLNAGEQGHAIIDSAFLGALEAADVASKVIFNLGCSLVGRNNSVVHQADCDAQLHVLDRIRACTSTILSIVSGDFGTILTSLIDRRNESVSEVKWTDDDFAAAVQAESLYITVATILTRVWQSLITHTEGSPEFRLPFEVCIADDQELLALNGLADENADDNDYEEIPAHATVPQGTLQVAPDYYVEHADDDDEVYD